jgi:hypothetical protein
MEKAEEEDNAWISKPTGLNLKIFRELRGQVSLLPVRLIEKEYLALAQEEVDHPPWSGSPSLVAKRSSCTTDLGAFMGREALYPLSKEG